MKGPETFANLQVGEMVGDIFARILGRLTGSHINCDPSVLLLYKYNRQGKRHQRHDETGEIRSCMDCIGAYCPSQQTEGNNRLGSFAHNVTPQQP
jgi:hypothetical protein